MQSWVISDEIVNVIQVVGFEDVKNNISAEVVPLLDKNVPPCGLVALKHIIDDGEFGSNALIGYRIVDEITQLTNVESKSMSSVFTPVSQDKFLIDMNSGTYGYYNPLSAQLKTVGKFPEM